MRVPELDRRIREVELRLIDREEDLRRRGERWRAQAVDAADPRRWRAALAWSGAALAAGAAFATWRTLRGPRATRDASGRRPGHGRTEDRRRWDDRPLPPRGSALASAVGLLAPLLLLPGRTLRRRTTWKGAALSAALAAVTPWIERQLAAWRRRRSADAVAPSRRP